MRNPLAIVGAVDIHLAATIGTIEQTCEGSRFAPAVWITPYIAADFLMLAVLVMFCLAGCGEKPMTAVYFHTDDNSWYFADLDTDTIFSGTIPDKLTDENGKKLTEEDMTDGDVYLIYGDGIMLESFPGQYPGITKMVRKEQGNQEKADHYRKELLSMMRPVTGE